MRPEDLILMIVIGVGLAVVLFILAFIFRKKKKIPIIIAVITIAFYCLLLFIYPSILSKIHENKYYQLEQYLQENYPEEEYEIREKDFSLSTQLGDFQVNKKDVPNRGNIYRVKSKGKIIQLPGSWQN